MPRSVWKGSISFGLVNVPVKMHTAVTERNVRFNQINSKTGARVRQQLIDSSNGDEVVKEDIVKGYELTPGRYIIIEPDELTALAAKKTKMIELEKFVPGEQIDSLIYDKGYYLAPEAGGARAYQMLVRAMEESGTVGIGTIVYGKEKIVALRPFKGRLVCSMLVFPDEVNSLDEIEVEESEIADREVAMANALIASLTGDFDHSEYQDTYRGQVLDLIERKAAGEEITSAPAEDEPVAQPDLAAALEASLAAIKPKGKRTAKAAA